MRQRELEVTARVLEIEAEGELEDACAGLVGSAHWSGRDDAEGLRRLEVERRGDKVDSIQKVIAFGAEGEEGALTVDAEALDDGHIGVEEARASECVASGIPNDTGGRDGK